jgi:4-pyridoxate dehydrogenase
VQADPKVESGGHTATEDYNGAQQEGFGRWQATIRDGRRCSAAVAYEFRLRRGYVSRTNITRRAAFGE